MQNVFHVTRECAFEVVLVLRDEAWMCGTLAVSASVAVGGLDDKCAMLYVCDHKFL